MNIFELYLDKIKKILLDLSKNGDIILPKNLNGITEQHFINFWGSARPTIGDVTGKVTDYGLREWQLVSLLSCTKIKKIWRFIFQVKKEKATLFCNVRNR